MTRKFKCVNKTKEHWTNDFDTGIIKQLLSRVQAEFPTIFTKKPGISMLFGTLLRPLVQYGAGPSKISSLITELYMLKYDYLQLQYYDFALYRQNNPSVNDVKYDQEFSKFDDPLKYTGHIPLHGYVSYVAH